MDLLPHSPNPVLQVHSDSRILIAGQAPGRKVHKSGVPFDDASGDRLRQWLGVDRYTFYDPKKIAILPMSFCFPGTGRSGDLPPLKACAPAWRDTLMAHMKQVSLTLLVGSYAIDYFFSDTPLTETVRNWKKYTPQVFPLPHPSPRNNIWLAKNPWFESECLPVLKTYVHTALLQNS